MIIPGIQALGRNPLDAFKPLPGHHGNAALRIGPGRTEIAAPVKIRQMPMQGDAQPLHGEKRISHRTGRCSLPDHLLKVPPDGVFRLPVIGPTPNRTQYENQPQKADSNPPFPKRQTQYRSTFPLW
jgi:hypothetical protein